MIRCFIGFLIPENAKDRIEEVQKEILKLPIKCKLVERENLHLNFTFLGDVNEEEIEKIKTKLNEVCLTHHSFKVNLQGVRAIPSVNFMRVIALNAVDDENLLEKLGKEIKESVGGDNKPPHLTLCRIKDVTNKIYVAEKLEEMKKLGVVDFLLDSIQLIKSELSREGPTYSVIHEGKLK